MQGGFSDIPPATAAFYDFDRQPGGLGDSLVPNTAPPGAVGDMDNSINYVIPTAAETAAIAAQARFKRPRGNTMPSNIPSTGGFTPTTEAAFQLFSPRTAALDPGDMGPGGSSSNLNGNSHQSYGGGSFGSGGPGPGGLSPNPHGGAGEMSQNGQGGPMHGSVSPFQMSHHHHPHHLEHSMHHHHQQQAMLLQ